jgi:ubiquinol-cytochrome c reductase cytochrome b subunit
MSASVVTPRAPGSDAPEHNWTLRSREYLLRDWPPERLLPEREPNYVSSWLYVFGVAGLAAFVSLVLTGTALAIEGPLWWHHSGLGRFLNDMHFWSVQLFFFVVFIHIGAVFFMAAWRNGRGLTWLAGAIVFFTAVTTGLTGYVITASWEGQWIALSAKDMLNALGIGGIFNLLDFGQFVTVHAVLMPVLLAVLIAWHVLLVRRHGVVEPFGTAEELRRRLEGERDEAATPGATVLRHTEETR